MDKLRIDDFLNNRDFSGTVSVFNGDDLLYSGGFGYRNIPDRLPNNTDTRFGIASGTKTFTSAGILALEEDGKLTLDATMGDIWRDCSFVHPEATVRQLLSHSSGIFDYYDEELVEDFDNYMVEIPWFQLETPSDYLPLFESKEMKLPPGSRVSYSNGGYVFLGILIEKLSGLTYRDFMTERILAPLGMASSGFYAFHSLPENTALGYMEKEGTLISNIYQLPIRGGGDGGMYTTSADMNSFWKGLFEGKALSEKSVKKMTSVEVEKFGSGSYGLGVYLSKLQGHRSYGAHGGDCGVGFSSIYVPRTGLNINVFSNRTDGSDGVADFVWKVLTAG